MKVLKSIINVGFGEFPNRQGIIIEKCFNDINIEDVRKATGRDDVIGYALTKESPEIKE